MHIEESLNDAIAIGSTVTVRDVETNEVDVYTLVPPSRADISLNRISSVTPIAHALYGRRVGEIAEVSAPAGAIRLQIVSIRPPVDEGEYG